MRKFFRKEDGQGLVEMALVMPILLLFFLGIFEFGRILGSFMVINNLAREGARCGAVGYSDTQIIDEVMSRLAWLDENQVSVVISPQGHVRKKGDAVEVKVNYEVDIIAPIIGEILPDPMPLSAYCIMRVEC